ncbi:MAG TPA: hypothetical protein DCW68_04335 [Rhodospirillaceae bacterium]|nr:MAG: hypothetical protein A2018_03315 [Alphaproteobacteria bacterium GWF2_58_20]HAU29324.1 hypothetical protein [Rhodospirillaceae bacterium]
MNNNDARMLADKLVMATRFANFSRAEKLLTQGAALEHRDTGAIHWTASHGNTDFLKKLLDAGASVHDRDLNDAKPIHYAAWNGRTETILFLLEEGAELESRTWDGQTPLFAATMHGHLETVNLLLDAGANPHGARDGQISPLNWAKTQMKNDAIAKRLEQATKDWDSRGYAGKPESPKPAPHP